MTRTTQTVRWGVLGTASIATKLSRAIRRAEGAELLGIASRSLERAEEWASTHKAGRAYGSYADMIGDPEIDAVYMPLPPSMHLEWTTKAAEVRKHVLCEKPHGLTKRHADRQLDLRVVVVFDGLFADRHLRFDREVLLRGVRYSPVHCPPEPPGAR